MKKHYSLTSIIIPAYNEEKNITRTIKDCLKLKKRYPIEVLVIDDGSKDNTAQVAKSAGATRVISYKRNKGKGGAFRVGIDSAKGDYIVQIDADHQFQPNEIPLFIETLNEGYDIVLGSRFNRGKVEKGSVSNINLFGNWLMSFTTTFFSGINVTDIMAGFKGFKTIVARKLDLSTPHFGYEAEIIVKAGKLGFSVKEIPITYTKRAFGTSGVSAIRDGSKVSFTIMKLYFTFPGPPLGQGIVGKKVLKIAIPIWLILALPTLTYLALKLPINSLPFLTQFFYSTIVFIFAWLITKSRLAGMISSGFFAMGNIFLQVGFIPTKVLFPKEIPFTNIEQPIHAIYLLILLVLFISLFLQDKKAEFIKLSALGLLLIYLPGQFVQINITNNFQYISNLGLIFITALLGRYFWRHERWIAWAFLASAGIMFLGLYTKIPYASLVGTSLFIGTFISSLFLEIVSFRKVSSSLLSPKRISLSILLVLFTLLVFIIKSSGTNILP